MQFAVLQPTIHIYLSFSFQLELQQQLVQKPQKQIQSFLQPQQQRVGLFQSSTPIRQHSQSARQSPLESLQNSPLHTPQPTRTTSPNIRQQSQTVDSPQQSTTASPNIQQQSHSSRLHTPQPTRTTSPNIRQQSQTVDSPQQSTTASPNIQQQSESSSLLVKRLLLQCRRRQPAQPTVPPLKQPALPDNLQQQVQESEPQPSTSAEPQPSTSAEPQPSTSASGYAPRSIFKRSHLTLQLPDDNLAVPLPSSPSSDPYDFDNI